eukprot:Pgem_evm1s5169
MWEFQKFLSEQADKKCPTPCEEGAKPVTPVESNPPAADTMPNPPITGVCLTVKSASDHVSCFKDIEFAMSPDGIIGNTQWYAGSGLTVKSSMWEFQKFLSEQADKKCPTPCEEGAKQVTPVESNPPAADTMPGVCLTVKSTSDHASCFKDIEFAMSPDGIIGNAQWYAGSGLTVQSSMWEFQKFLSEQADKKCPTPCEEGAKPVTPVESNDNDNDNDNYNDKADCNAVCDSNRKDYYVAVGTIPIGCSIACGAKSGTPVESNDNDNDNDKADCNAVCDSNRKDYYVAAGTIPIGC